MRQTKKVLSEVASRCRKAGVYFFVALMLMLIGGVYAQRQAVYDQLYSWKLIPRPERLTELFFTEHTKLPTKYAPAQQQTVKFTTHNLEYRKTTYKYVISQESQDGKAKQQLTAGGFTLEHDKAKTTEVPIQLTDLGSRSRIVISLSYDGIAFGQDLPSEQTQSIYYWTTKEGITQ
ncbi:MAG TPA: DUF1616 domain-containing protein [Patescibacteria group bacterium]|nr:DUF1616 domain-containing protein [Patescibacteria group bacterium]